MYANHIAAARTQLLALKNELGTDALLAHISQFERLWELIQAALKRVSDHAGGLDEFHDALVQLREFLDSARETLRVVEKDVDDLHYSREASQEAVRRSGAHQSVFTGSRSALLLAPARIEPTQEECPSTRSDRDVLTPCIGDSQMTRSTADFKDAQTSGNGDG